MTQPAKKKKKQSSRPKNQALKPKSVNHIWSSNFPWIGLVCVITALAYYPMLSNGFTNWDDQFYITNNAMLPGPDWNRILTKPLMANYHPLTITTLAINYQISALEPFSYHLVNWLLHILNTGLVFLLAFRLADRNHWVGLITALLFGVHPMHVESVAWASERKDVLFTLFFLLSLLCWLQFNHNRNWKNYSGALVLFLLSLLSKPAAVTLPLVLLLIDVYQGRSWKDTKVWLEKIPFFAFSLLFGALTLKYQSAVKAIAEADTYPLWQKLGFSIYGFGEYIKRIAWPFPMSAIHPFPESGSFPTSYLPSVIVAVLVIGCFFYFRKNKHLQFGIAFFAINIALVLQLLTFGHAIIAERYTYVPYIGLFFALAMLWSGMQGRESLKKGLLYVILLVTLGFAVISFRQVQVWKNGQTLWTNAINTYPDSYIARSNRGQFLAAKLNQYDQALEDFRIALIATPNDSFTLINRATIYLNQQNYPAALADGDSLTINYPHIPKGHLFRGMALNGLGQTDPAFDAFTQCIRRDSFVEEAWSNRGILRYNKRQDYTGAKEDFDYAIRVNPKGGLYYKNRARCWIKFGNKSEALKDLEMARSLGETISKDLMQSAQSMQ